ncbi:NAD(P)-dependent oxidoreductase [Nitrospira lenta]|uniref:Putative 3-hydroxyisobutyrate dehydrogenase-like 1, mitochondrial n=1 Tax=Nitrospira lenta TaxID=1436998 RepID=A0A330L4I5_9BACT|nr:NAD(P)-dependent oxidoreductase [Nitrospira lenta]SPP64701.1 putative 3-hydroxyisobutyrate dehydrogenase-like 1, mitochondrial [Nitrospira lenta]
MQQIAPNHSRIGWIGTGVMGASMCGHLQQASYPITLYSRTKAKAQPLLDRGASWADSPRAVADRSTVIVTMVGFPRDVREVYFGPQGILAGARPGSILIDMTTTEPALSREIDAAASAQGLQAIDAPVSGGDVGARNATLSVMAGGNPKTVEWLHPLFECLGKKIVYQGGAGAGQQTKLCNQIVIAGTMVGVCESLLYGFNAGLDLTQMLDSIRGGAAACWTLDNLAPKILQRNFDPGFFVEHFVKDMGIALDEAARMNLPLPGLALAQELYHRVQALGHGRCGTHALMLALEDLSRTPITMSPSRKAL